MNDRQPAQQVLLIHGLTYASHEFDVDYKDYSVAQSLAKAGFGVWRLDLSGYGESEKVQDGFVVDANRAVTDIAAAVAHIRTQTDEAKVDLFGWSWGTVTAARMAIAYPDWIRRLVLYAPIVQGLDQPIPTEPWHHNSWNHAAADFPMRDGEIDVSKVELPVAAMFLSNCWRYDGTGSPNGGRRDLMVGRATSLIHFAKIAMPTLLIGGTADPYLNWGAIAAGFQQLSQRARSKLVQLQGGKPSSG